MTTHKAEPTPGKRRRPWLQFSVRALLIATTIAGIALGWVAYERQKVAAQRAAIRALEAANGRVQFDENARRWPAWLRFVVGDDFPGEVVGASLGGKSLTAEQFAQLRRFPHLKELRVMTVRLDAGLVDLSGLTELQSLSIHCDQIIGTEFKSINACKHLKSVEIRGGEMNATILEFLAVVPEVQSLMLDGSRVGNEGLRHVARLTTLRELDLCDTAVTDDGLDSIANLMQLVYLRLNGLPVSDAGLSKLKNLRNLKYLHLRYCEGISDDGLAHLTAFQQLEELEIGPFITDAGIEHLERLPNLKRVALHQTSVTGEGIARLHKRFSGIDIFEAGPPLAREKE